MMVGNAIEHGGWTNATFVGYRFSETDRRVAATDDMGHFRKSVATAHPCDLEPFR